MTTPESKKASVAYSIHPEYLDRSATWEKFRYILRGGDEFIEQYVKQFSEAEEAGEFSRRKEVTPVAGFAKAAVFDVKNSIFQRMGAIKRLKGTETWRAANKGQMNGVDLQGSTMNHFIGTEVLPELLAMGKVGVFVDSAYLEGTRTKADEANLHPYVYTFQCEDIRNWEYYLKGSEVRLKQVLLRVRSEPSEDSFGLLSDWVEQYRHFWIDENGQVWLQVYDSEGTETNLHGDPLYPDPIPLEIDEIPLIVLELRSALLEDIANHQIALTNLESADVTFLCRANIPFYTEQHDPRFDAINNQGNEDYWSTTEYDENDTAQLEATDNVSAIKLGSTDGRRYGKGLDRPGFIHPSSEPITASMEKQKALKDDIRTLINLAISNTKTRFASAESKELDERGLESGLSAVGLILEHAERRIGEIWCQKYEASTEEVFVKYPERYSLRSDEDRRKDAQQLSDSASAVSSVTFRREIQKEIAEILLSGKVDDSTLDKILEEIDISEAPTADPEQIRSDVEAGLVTRATASVARGWPKGEAEKARQEKADLEAMRARAQISGQIEPGGDNLDARGLSDDDPLAAKREKQVSQDPENNPDGIRRVRGKGK